MVKILVVEDDEAVRTLAARALQRAGYIVDLAADGAVGLEAIHAARGRYDLVISDVRMPSMNGIDMTRKAVAAYPGLRVMLMTGYCDQRDTDAELRDIVCDVMQKPFSLADIRERVASLMATETDSAA
jgi:DNA-binding NtrC family response regulator